MQPPNITPEQAPNKSTLPKILQEVRFSNVRDIQTSYFQLLEEYFHLPLETLKSSPDRFPDEVADLYTGDSVLYARIAHRFDDFVATMQKFWETNAPTIGNYLASLQNLKALFGGDIFPQFTSGIAGSAGIYFDTTILRDPVLQVCNYMRGFSTDQFALNMLIKHVLTLVKDFKEIVLADVEPSMFLIAPDPFAMNPKNFKLIGKQAMEDMLRHFSLMFGSEFKTFEGLMAFLKQLRLSSIDEVVVDRNRFLSDILFERTPSCQLRESLGAMSEVSPEVLSKSTFADEIERIFWGRFLATNRDVYLSGIYSAVPVIEAPTSWEYFLWKNQYDAERSIPPGYATDDLLFAKALQTGQSKEVLVLNGLPPEALIQLRRHGAMDEMRKILRQNVDLLEQAKPDELQSVAEQVSTNLDNAMEAHRRELGELESSRKKVLGWDITRFLATSSLTIAGAWTNNQILTVSGAIATTLVGAPALSDLHKNVQDFNAHVQQLKRSPAGILFEHFKNKPND